MSGNDTSNPQYIRSPEENVQHITKLAEQLAISEKRDEEMSQQVQTQSEQLQQRLQALGNTTISTRGQITELEMHLEDQIRDKHRIEGALDILQAMTR